MSDSAIIVKQSSTVINPVGAAGGVLLGFLGGFLVKDGLISQTELGALVPAVLTLAVAGWRAWVSHARAKRAVTLAHESPTASVK